MTPTPRRQLRPFALACLALLPPAATATAEDATAGSTPDAVAPVAAAAGTAEPVSAEPPVAIVIHGGAGAPTRERLTPEREAAVRQQLADALRAGHAILTAGGSSLDAVTTAVAMLEDSPLFNAGKGAVFNADGVNELDASIMEGHTRRAGAVAGVRRVKNPIRLARAVMERSPHVMLVGDGAEAFAAGVDVELVDPAYFATPERRDELDRARAKEAAAAAAALANPPAGATAAGDGEPTPPESRHGTVGAVALDRHGHLAAATSTGGRTNKRWGRIGDSPIIGAGTYADSRCAVSATGWGEFYIRAVATYDICARVAYRSDSIRDAAEEVVLRVVPGLGGDGGAIAMDAAGNVAMPFDTPAMYRGVIDTAGRLTVAIFRDE